MATAEECEARGSIQLVAVCNRIAPCHQILHTGPLKTRGEQTPRDIWCFGDRLCLLETRSSHACWQRCWCQHGHVVISCPYACVCWHFMSVVGLCARVCAWSVFHMRARVQDKQGREHFTIERPSILSPSFSSDCAGRYVFGYLPFFFSFFASGRGLKYTHSQ